MKHPATALRPAARTRIKICGLTREEDLDAAVAAAVAPLRLVLYPPHPPPPPPPAPSPRRAPAPLPRRLPPFVPPVLLFVTAPATDVLAACAAIPGATIQFHGDESAQDCLAATGQGARPYLRAARIPLGDGTGGARGGGRFDLVQYTLDHSQAQAILLDAHVDGYGGSGKVFNWSLLPPNVDCHLVLSGGLTPANVADGILQVRPRCKTLAVDVSSGVEADGPDGKPLKGIKDAGKIQRFVAAVRAADAQLARNPDDFLSTA